MNNDSPMAEKLIDLPFYTEGPVVDGDGDLYFTTQMGGTILKLNGRNELSEWGKSKCPNGQIILPDKDHLICDSLLGAVRRFNKHGDFVKNEIEGFCSDVRIVTPNDLIADKQQNIYFTDSVRHTGKVCFVGVNGEQKIVVSDLDYPNGLVLSPDGNSLYVAESYKNRIIRITLKSAGVAKGEFDVFSVLPVHQSRQEKDNLPDGLAWNNKGELLVAHYGMGAVQKVTADGTASPLTSLGMPHISNLCFKDNRTLFVTGGYGEPGPGAVFKIGLS
jgi:gluconolactonase